MESVSIRLAQQSDLAAINEIYNYYVIHSTCTYQLEPEPASGRERWFADHGPAHPVTVAVAGGQIVGWGALSRFHPRAAYARSVENSIYVRPEYFARGIGRALLADLIERARQAAHHTIIALIDAEQPRSIALHARAGFAQAGRIREAGYKFEKWLDVVYMQLML
jgi:phosphinothricin acetyltransferase